MNRTTKRIGALGTATLAVMGTGIAFAAWTSSGTGSGSAASTTPQDVAFTGVTPTTSLYPTGSANITFHSTNPNSYKVSLESLAVTKVAYDSAPATDVQTICDLTYHAPATAPLVAAGGADVTVTGGLSMGNGADQACAGKTFVVTLTATPTSHV